MSFRVLSQSFPLTRSSISLHSAGRTVASSRPAASAAMAAGRRADCTTGEAAREGERGGGVMSCGTSESNQLLCDSSSNNRLRLSAVGLISCSQRSCGTTAHKTIRLF